MKKVYQTKNGIGGNCFASCIASILECNLEDVDVGLTECKTWVDVFNRMRDLKKLVKPYDMISLPYWLFKSAYKYRGLHLPTKCHCIISSPSSIISGNPTFHAVVGYIDDKENLTVVHNPSDGDFRTDYFLQHEDKLINILFLVKH